MIDRRTLIATGAALAAKPALAVPAGRGFPRGFLWGAATAGHQVEGNNTASDAWATEQVTPTISPPSGDAVNSFELWERDLDLVRGLGLNAYRFSLEWARIEPAEGQFSQAMLDHYKRMVEGCRARGLAPVVTFNHYAAPRWFAARGGWTSDAAPALFARFCDRAARHLGAGIAMATTLNEPNILSLLQLMLPPPFWGGMRAMLAAAARANGSDRFVLANAANPEDLPALTRNMIAGHRAGRDAIKAVRPDLPVGFSLAMTDDQSAGGDARRDAVRDRLYGAWLPVAAEHADFLGVQNYERAVWGPDGKLPPPADARLNSRGSEVYPPSLAGAVRYAHAATRKPIVVTEHGVGTSDDGLRAWLIAESLPALKAAIDDGVPVLGYLHWSLLDNYEWAVGFDAKFGLVAVDRTSFVRTPKPSAHLLGSIARRNAL